MIWLLRIAAALLASALLLAAAPAPRGRLARGVDLSRFGALEVVVPAGAADIERAAAQRLEGELLKILPNLGGAKNGRERGRFVFGARWRNPKKPSATLRVYFENTRALEADLPLEELLKLNRHRISAGCGFVVLEYPAAARAGFAAGKFLRGMGAEYFSPRDWGAEYSDFSPRIKKGSAEFYPAFFAVRIYGIPLARGWAEFNGLDVGDEFFEFSHNLQNIFPARGFAENPEFFPLLKNPRGVLARSPCGQPDILSPAVQRRAAQAALAGLARGRMFSIGISDTQIFDERAEYLKYKRGYFRGVPDWSDAVFEFSNAVAREVAKSRPNAILGALAYLICENPPSFKLEKNIIPFFTTDRANYADAEFMRGDFRALRGWGNSGAATFGIYDYSYGEPYLFAREISEYIAMGIAKAHGCGARFYYAEAYPLWGYDAKKMWLTARMLENPRANYAALEDFFYRKYFKSAAAPMREFFGLAAGVWRQRKIPPRWLALYKAENALELLDLELLSRMEAALGEAAAAASADPDKNALARVREVEKLFAYTKSAYLAHAAKVELFDTLGAGAQRLASAALKLERRKAEFALARAEVARLNPRAQMLDFYDDEKFSPSGALAWRFATDAAAMRAGVPEFVRASEEFAAARKLAGGAAARWEISSWANYENFLQARRLDYCGETLKSSADGRFLEMQNCQISGVGRVFDVRGCGAARLFGRVSNAASAGTLCYATAVFLDARGNVLGRKTFVFPNRNNAEFNLVAAVPAGASRMSAAVFATRQKAGDNLKIFSMGVEIAK